MNFKMFFEFPGVLILVGVVLLIISIILGFISYKSADVIEESTKNEDLNEDLKEDNILPQQIEEESFSKVDNIIEELPLENIEPEEEVIEETEENITEEDVELL